MQTEVGRQLIVLEFSLDDFYFLGDEESKNHRLRINKGEEVLEARGKLRSIQLSYKRGGKSKCTEDNCASEPLGQSDMAPTEPENLIENIASIRFTFVIWAS